PLRDEVPLGESTPLYRIALVVPLPHPFEAQEKTPRALPVDIRHLVSHRCPAVQITRRAPVVAEQVAAPAPAEGRVPIDLQNDPGCPSIFHRPSGSLHTAALLAHLAPSQQGEVASGAGEP